MAIEAVGVPATFQACVDIIRPHRFIFDQLDEAYDTFSRAAETKALKVVLTR